MLLSWVLTKLWRIAKNKKTKRQTRLKMQNLEFSNILHKSEVTKS